MPEVVVADVALDEIIVLDPVVTLLVSLETVVVTVEVKVDVKPLEVEDSVSVEVVVETGGTDVIELDPLLLVVCLVLMHISQRLMEVRG